MGSYYHCLEDCCHRNAGWCPPPPRRQFLVELDCLTPKRRTICLNMSFWRPSSYNDKGYSTYHGWYEGILSHLHVKVYLVLARGFRGLRLG